MTNDDTARDTAGQPQQAGQEGQGGPAFFQAGRRAERAGDLEAARIDYERALSAGGEDRAEWHYRLGCVHLKSGHLERAAARFMRSCELQPGCGRYLTNLGATRDRQGRRAEAIQAYQKAIFHDDATAETYHNLGAIYAEDGRREDAIRAFEAAIERAPDAEGYLALGLVHLAGEDFPPALECFERAVRRDASFARGHYFAGLCLMKQGVYAQAVERFELALRLDGRLVRAHFNIGVCLHKLERYDEALRSLQRALEAFPEDGRLHYRLALTHDALGSPHEARRHYSLARSIPAPAPEMEAES
jgi:tetratricopeptide (TPR) repeat protein